MKELVFLYIGFIGDQFFYKESSWYFWETIVAVRYWYKINFPATTKNWHNRTTVLYTKYVRNTKNYFLLEPKKLNNCMVLQVHSSMYNQNLFPARTKNWHNSKTGKKVPPAHAKHGQVPPAHAKQVYLEEPISSGYPAHLGLTWRNQFLLVTQPT